MIREWRIYRLPEPELRAASDGTGDTLTGYAAVYERFSQNLGGFVENVAPGAFEDAVGRDLVGLVNHDPNWLLGTIESDTLVVELDDIGMRYAIPLDPDDPDAVRARAKVKSKKMRGSSFSFMVAEGGDDWSLTPEGFPLRTLRNIAKVYDVGPVTMPAYRATTDDDLAVALRSLGTDAPAAARSGVLASLIDTGAEPPPPIETTGDMEPVVRSDRWNTRTTSRLR